MSGVTAGLRWHARLLAYDGWANREAVASLRSGEPPPKAVRWMAHIVGAGELWLARLRRQPASLPVWPDLDLDGCAAGVARLAERWPRWLETLDQGGLEETVVYRNSRGESWTSTVADILTHVSLHGAYHRAQIAAAVRENGGEPASTDFIHAVRRGLIP